MINQKDNDEGFYVEMGFRLKQIRQMKKISQQDLAMALGVVMQTIQKYESGEVRLLPELIQKCAKFFNVPIGYFYGEELTSRKLSRVTLMIASEVMMLPNDDIKKSVYSLIRNINTAWEQDNNEDDRQDMVEKN